MKQLFLYNVNTTISVEYNIIICLLQSVTGIVLLLQMRWSGFFEMEGCKSSCQHQNVQRKLYKLIELDMTLFMNFQEKYEFLTVSKLFSLKLISVEYF